MHKTIAVADEEQQELSCIAGGDARLCSLEMANLLEISMITNSLLWHEQNRLLPWIQPLWKTWQSFTKRNIV